MPEAIAIAVAVIAVLSIAGLLLARHRRRRGNTSLPSLSGVGLIESGVLVCPYCRCSSFALSAQAAGFIGLVLGFLVVGSLTESRSTTAECVACGAGFQRSTT